VTVKGNDAAGGNDHVTGLASSDTFCWASAIGDDGSLPGDVGAFKTDANDVIDVVNNLKTLLSNIAITNPYDYNRDGRVDASDQLAARNHATTNLTAPVILNIWAAPQNWAAAAAQPGAVGAMAASSVSLAPPTLGNASATSQDTRQSDAELGLAAAALSGRDQPSAAGWLNNTLIAPPIKPAELPAAQTPAAHAAILDACVRPADKKALQADSVDEVFADFSFD
jgi:hypothetical protein